MKIKGILAAVLITMIGVAMAEEIRRARIDVEGTVDNVKTAMDFTSSDGGVGKQADWLKEDKDKRLTIEFPASKEWKKYSFTFNHRQNDHDDHVRGVIFFSAHNVPQIGVA